MPRQESAVAARLELPGIGLCAARTWSRSLCGSRCLPPLSRRSAPAPAARPLAPGRGSAGGGGDKARTGARRAGGRAGAPRSPPRPAPPGPSRRHGRGKRGRSAPRRAVPYRDGAGRGGPDPRGARSGVGRPRVRLGLAVGGAAASEISGLVLSVIGLTSSRCLRRGLAAPGPRPSPRSCRRLQPSRSFRGGEGRGGACGRPERGAGRGRPAAAPRRTRRFSAGSGAAAEPGAAATPRAWGRGGPYPLGHIPRVPGGTGAAAGGWPSACRLFPLPSVSIPPRWSLAALIRVSEPIQAGAGAGGANTLIPSPGSAEAPRRCRRR